MASGTHGPKGGAPPGPKGPNAPKRPGRPPFKRSPKGPARKASPSLLPPDLGKVDSRFHLLPGGIGLEFGPWRVLMRRGEGGLSLADLWATLIDLVSEGEAEWAIPDGEDEMQVVFDVDGPTVMVGIYGSGRYRGMPTPERCLVRLAGLVASLAAVLEAGLVAGDRELHGRDVDLRHDLAVARAEVEGMPVGWKEEEPQLVTLGFTPRSFSS